MVDDVIDIGRIRDRKIDAAQGIARPTTAAAEMGAERGECYALGVKGVRRIGYDSVVGILNGGREDGGVQVELQAARS